MRRLATFIAPYWAHLASGLISLILLTGTQLFIPRYAGVTVDEIIRTGSMAVVNRAALVALAVLGLRSLLLYGQLYFGLFLGHRVIADIRRLVFQRVQRWSLDRFAGWTSSDLITRSLQDTQVVQSALLVGLLDFIGTALTVAGITVMPFVLECHLARRRDGHRPRDHPRDAGLIPGLCRHGYRTGDDALAPVCRDAPRPGRAGPCAGSAAGAGRRQ